MIINVRVVPNVKVGSNYHFKCNYMLALKRNHLFILLDLLKMKSNNGAIKNNGMEMILWTLDVIFWISN
jgi:hypothetical protein